MNIVMNQGTGNNSNLHTATATPDQIILGVDETPFNTVLTFEHLIDHWRTKAIKEESVSKDQLEHMEKRLANVPELLGAIEDLSLLEKHKDILEFLIAPFFPVLSWNTEIKALGKLFSDRIFYTSPRFEKVIGQKGSFILREENQDNKNLTLFWRLLYSYKLILEKFYQLPLVIDQPMIYTIPHISTGLDQYYKLNSSGPFSQLVNIGPLPDLENKTFDYLVNNFHNMDLWMEHLPPANFLFSGFSIHSFVDVTVEEATARLEQILRRDKGNISDANFDQLQRELRILFRLPDIRLGLASIQGDGALNLHSRKKSWNSLKIREIQSITHDEIDRSVYGKIIREGQSMIIEDIGKWKGGAWIETELIRLGVKNLVLSPLIYQEQLVGMIEITSPNPGDINALSSYKLRKVIQFFARAVHKNRERFENQVQKVIKENYTAIHPTVEWRFREAAIHTLDQQQSGESVEPEPIIFEKVVPLYGGADVRGSSDLRNQSIRDDLIDHMTLAVGALQKVNDIMPMAIHSELEYTLNRKIREIEKGMSPGDESSTIDFNLNEVNPLLRHLHKSNPSLQSILISFMEQTQAGTILLNNHRNAYESSLKAINETIAGHLLREQQHLQKIFPHYFELYQTDGVEYNMYIGPSLVNNREFDPVYLRNLQLHQLISACQIARKINHLRPKLKKPLLISQLILVHNSPINISFRMEEKKFDVEGAYNVRYEIMKKRIDKALVKGSDERITQPGHIAVIYSMDKELAEYARYIEFLQAQGYIKKDPEFFELEEMQGVHGLKAIRLEVELNEPPEDSSNEIMDILEVAGKIDYLQY